MLVNPFIDLSDSHEVLEQDSIIIPSYAPLTQTLYNGAYDSENETSLIKELLPKTSNTVFIKNLSYNSDKMSITNLLLPFGEISSIMHYNLKGFAIATFFDSRSAENFVKNMDGAIVERRRIRCDLMLKHNPAFEEQYLKKCPNVALKFLVDKNISRKMIIDKKTIEQFALNKYGEIRQIIDCRNGIFIIEFYDFRNAQKLVQDNENVLLSEFKFQPSYVLDISNIVNQFQNEQKINKYDYSLPNFIY